MTRDPHAHVRRVVATHARITEEVAFRLCEDQQDDVRLALRKNPACPPFIAIALAARDMRGRDKALASAEHLLEAAWQARRAGLKAGELVELATEWLGIADDQIDAMTLEQVTLLLQVLEGKLGIGPMPSKPRKRGSKTSKGTKKKAKKKPSRSK